MMIFFMPRKYVVDGDRFAFLHRRFGVSPGLRMRIVSRSALKNSFDGRKRAIGGRDS